MERLFEPGVLRRELVYGPDHEAEEDGVGSIARRDEEGHSKDEGISFDERDH